MTEERGIDRRTFVHRAGALGALTASGGLTALLSACGGDDTQEAGATTAGAAVRGGRAVFATVDKPVNMDPADAQLYSSMQVYQNIFHKLVNVDADFSFVPGLASKWTQDDEKTWTLDLVDNAVFHNGEPFTADDVKFSFDRLPEHANGIFVQAWKETEVLSKNRVRFHLSQPYGPVVATLAAIGDMVNEKAVTSADPKLKPVGTGPYQMTEWVTDDHITLQRWDQFFKPDKPYLDEVVFRAIGDESVRLTGLQTGELDWIQRVPAQRVEEVESMSGISSSEGKPYLPDMVMFNCSKPPFNDPRVRQAVAWLVDREEIVNLVWFGTAVAATEAVSPPSPWHSGEDPYEGGPDPEKAKSLLKQAGQENLQHHVRRPAAGCDAGAHGRGPEVPAGEGRHRDAHPELRAGAVVRAACDEEVRPDVDVLERDPRSGPPVLPGRLFEVAVELPRQPEREDRCRPGEVRLHHRRGGAQVRVPGRRDRGRGGRADHLPHERDPALLDPGQHRGRRTAPVARDPGGGCVARIVVGRLALSVPMLLGMSVLVFLIIRLVPGDPVLAVLGLNATPELVARLREELGLNDPIYVQYVNWLGDLLQGDFGLDYRSNEPIGSLLLERLPVTLELTGMALLLAIVFAIPLGVLGAVRRGRVADKATQGISMVGISIPDFWLGIMLILVFSLGLGILPSSGFVPFREDPVENIRHMILPSLALAAGLAGVLIRVTRAAMLDVLHEDYIRFTRAKGVSERAVVFKHALRNAAIPIVTVVGLQAGYLLGGAIVIEYVFALPGVGRLVLDSVLQRNYPLVQASVLMVGLMFVLTNVAADLLYAVLNPKLRTEGE